MFAVVCRMATGSDLLLIPAKGVWAGIRYGAMR